MFQYRRLFLLALAYILCTYSARQMQAQSTSLSFDSLPTAQGWVYSTTRPSVPETSVFSVSNSTLHQNTLGQGAFQAYYELRNFIDASKPFVLSMRARLLEEENIPGATYGFFFQLNIGAKSYSVSITTHGFRIGTGSEQGTNNIDTSQFHDYRIEGSPTGSFGFYVDNVLFTTSSAFSSSNPNSIAFGDGTPTGSNARADITSFRYYALVTVSGSVLLQNAVNRAQSIDFTFRPTTGSSFTRTLTLDASGSYSIPNIPVGNYTLSIKGTKWLRKNITVNANTGDVTNANATLLAGDANNDNFADIADLLLLIAHYNQVSPNAGYSDAADFNCDGVNDIADLLLLVANYNKQGDM